MKKWFSVILSILLVLSLAACGERTSENTTIHLISGQTYGTGKYTFDLVVTDPDGVDTAVTIKTDKDTLGPALLQLGIVDGEQSSFGLYITTVNGITLDYDKDQRFWALYENGELASSGADATPIEDGAVYSLKAQ